MRTLRLPALLALFSLACASPPAHAGDAHHFPVQKTDAEWKAQLTPGQYAVLRKAATERPFTGALNDNHEKGVYRCAACGHLLFRSDAKFDSGTGWPSFFQPAEKGSIVTRPDPGIFGTQTEVVCANCGGHLGHVFDDGPAPTGLRYCMNSAAMRFEKAK